MMKPKVENMRPISAVNKLTKIKRNFLPRLNSGVNIHDKSASPNHTIIQTRIKSALPLNLDKERLYEENINLKNEINKLKKDLNNSKKENYNLEIEINKKDKILEDLAADTQNSMINQIENMSDLYSQNKLLTKATETHLIVNLKKQFKELKKELNKKKEEMEDSKRTLKLTKINEMTLENKTLFEEISKLKTLYEFSLQQNSTNEKSLKDLAMLKENFNKQEFIITNLQENIKNIQDVIFSKEDELAKSSKLINDKMTQINKLKKDLKFQYQINERLINSTSNIKQSSEYITLKNEMDKKLSDMKKDSSYYKDLAEKRDRKARDLESFIKNSNSKENFNNLNNNNNNVNSLYGNSNFHKNEDNSEDKANTTILLLKSKLQEVMKDRDTHKSLNDELNNKLSKYENGSEKDVKRIDMALSANDLNYDYNYNPDKNDKPEDIKNPLPTSSNLYEYLNDFNLNELIYILIKNFEANKFDVNIIEERVMKDANSNDLVNILSTNEKEFAEKLTNNILNLLKVKNEKDKKSIYSFVKTFIHNNYTAKENTKSEEFKTKFLSLFETITFYSGDQKQTYNKSLCKKIYKYKTLLHNAITFYDEDKTGFISFVTLRKILEQIRMHLSNNLIEYFIYLMKNFNDENASIHDLKYENLFKAVQEYETEMGKDDKDEHSEEDEIDGGSNAFGSDNDHEIDEEDNDAYSGSAIEITTEDYLKKVSNVIKKIVLVLKSSETKLDDYFSSCFLPNVKEYRAIELGKLVTILNEEFNIILDQIDVYCLFTKLKHVEEDESMDEVVDYDKLIKEVENFFKNSMSKINVDLKINNKSKCSQKEYIDTSHKFEIPTEDFIQLIKSHLNKSKTTFEGFISSISDKIQNTYLNDTHNQNNNRYLDINAFENLLLINELIVVLKDPVDHKKLLLNKNSYNLKIDETVLYNNSKINLDYLKYIIESNKSTNNVETKQSTMGKQFFTFESSLNKNKIESHEDDYKEAFQSASNREFEKSPSESSEGFKKLQMELLNEEDDENLDDFIEDAI